MVFARVQPCMSNFEPRIIDLEHAPRPHCCQLRLVKNCFADFSFLGRPLFSVDIHPDGSRFAIGGQGTWCTCTQFTICMIVLAAGNGQNALRALTPPRW